MSEKKSVRIKRPSVLRKAFVTLVATQVTCASSFSLLMAHPAGGHDEHCTPQLTTEQSIVISARRVAGSESSAALATDAPESLQPIAKVSPQEPDLAEPVALEPTLADSIATEQGIQQKEATPLVSIKEQKQTELAVTAETEAISFQGITPGISERIHVLRTWGDPRSDDTQAAVLKYRIDNLPSVEVRFEGNQVDSIVVQLAKPKSKAKLCEKLGLERLRSVALTGNQPAEIYPERGVLLRYASPKQEMAIASDQEIVQDTGPRIDEIVIQSIQAEPFLQRAGENVLENYTYAIADLEAALRVDRTLAIARHQLSELYLKIGQAVTSERYAAEAVELEPKQATYRLQWAKSLRQLARYDRAVTEARQVLETPGISLLLRAQALNEMGWLTSLGSKEIARRATSLHEKAIEIADGLTVSNDLQVSRSAQQLLVEAHLAVAVGISQGDWQQKDESAPQWIERASALAESLIEAEPSYLPLRLQVAVSALAAAANFDKPINPLLWVEEAEGTFTKIKANVDDPLTVSQYDWQLGLAYFHGAQIEHRRSQPDSAIRLGDLADQQLAELAVGRDEMPDTAYLMGRLYFQMGAVHAVHYEDHAAACQWYQQAATRLLNPVPVTINVVPQQHGDALVSMGVSYWSVGDHQLAIEVTEAGLELVEQAVASGLLQAEALKVPYTNLAAMYGAQGEQESATRYEQLAREATATKVSQRTRTQGKPKSLSRSNRSKRR